MLTNDEQLTEIIIGAAINVLNKLKPGLKTALLLNFKHARLQIKRVSN